MKRTKAKTTVVIIINDRLDEKLVRNVSEFHYKKVKLSKIYTLNINEA